MKVIKTTIPGLLIIEPQVSGDELGFFLQTYHFARYRDEAGLVGEYVQDNHSRSSRGVLRSLHFQKIKPQGKLVRCILGEVYDSSDEGGIAWNDPALAIPWPVTDPKLSGKDKTHPNFFELT